MIIVIDGPAGSGKSSTARAVADKLNLQYLDSGALYRTLTLIYIRAQEEGKEFFSLLNDRRITFIYKDGVFYTFINDDDVTREIRSVKVSDHVSEVAAIPDSRRVVNQLMRDAVEKGGYYIAEGRDLGTAVFPDADLKFFMTADVDERARRRYKELKDDDVDVTFEEIKRNIENRDRRDSNREADPLRKADDAIEINTSNVTFEQQVEIICSRIKRELNITTN